MYFIFFFFFSSRRRHTRCSRDWSSDVCSSDLRNCEAQNGGGIRVGPSSHSNVSDIVIYNNLIHDNGDWLLGTDEEEHDCFCNSSEAQQKPGKPNCDQDTHAIGITVWCTGCEDSRLRRVWIVDNEMYHNSGDSVQVNSAWFETSNGNAK